jgi:hypothetical protein
MNHLLMPRLKTFSLVSLCLIGFHCFSEDLVDSTAKPLQFATSTTITNNGISVIPIFSLGKPAAIINFTIGRKFTFEPEFRLSLEGKPWAFIYWFRYKLIKTKKFSWGIGAHPALIYKTIPVVSNGIPTDLIRVQRFLAAEMTQSYRFNKHTTMGLYYLLGAGSIENGTKPTNLLVLRGGVDNVELGKGFMGAMNPQLIYLFTNGQEGSYANMTFILSHKKSPVSLNYFVNTPLNSNIVGGQDLVWSVGATYVFNRLFVPAK